MAPHLQQHINQWIQGTDKDKYHMISFNHGIFLKNDTNELIYNSEIVTDIENKLKLPKGIVGKVE